MIQGAVAWMRMGVFLLLLSSCIHAFASDPSEGDRQRFFLQAVETFENATSPEEYRKSAELFESVLDGRYQSGMVYYNAGNAYFRAGHFGRAILNYRKSQVHRPRDPYLHANLQQALRLAPGQLTNGSVPVWKRVLFWGDWLSITEKWNITTCGALFASVAAFLGYWRRSSVERWIARLSFVVSLIVFGELMVTSPEWLAPTRAVVVSETVARKGTDDSYEPAFDRPLRDGAEFTILNSTKDWTFGHFEGIGDGWVKNDAIAR